MGLEIFTPRLSSHWEKLWRKFGQEQMWRESKLEIYMPRKIHWINSRPRSQENFLAFQSPVGVETSYFGLSVDTKKVSRWWLYALWALIMYTRDISYEYDVQGKLVYSLWSFYRLWTLFLTTKYITYHVWRVWCIIIDTVCVIPLWGSDRKHAYK